MLNLLNKIRLFSAILIFVASHSNAFADTATSCGNSPPPYSKAVLIPCAKALLAKQRAHSAWRLLQPYEISFAGEPDYDYLLGLAGLDSRRTGEAVLAFQRVLAVKPNFTGARYELGQALLQLGDLELAESQFLAVLAEQPPKKLEKATQRSLAKLRQLSSQNDFKFSGQLKLGYGYNNNATSGTDNTTFSIGAIEFDLDENSTKNSSSILKASGNLQVSKAISNKNTIAAKLKLKAQDPNDLDNLDTRQASISLGLFRQSLSYKLSLAAKASQTKLAGEENNRASALTFGLENKLSSSTVTQVAARYGQIRYNSSLETQDVNQLVAALGFGLRKPKYKLDSLLLIGRYKGINAENFSRDLSGASIRLSQINWGFAEFSASLNYIKTDFDGLHFGMERQDRQRSATAAVKFKNIPFKQWHIRHWWKYVNQNSTISLHEYDGWETGLELVFDF